MRQGPAPAGPGRDGDPAREPGEPVPSPDPMTEEEWLAWCDSQVDPGEPPDPGEEEPDPDGLPGPWEYDLDAVVADAGGSPRSRPRRVPGRPGWGWRAGSRSA